MAHATIKTLDDVMPHISGRTDFVVADRDGYRVVDYTYAAADTFDNPMRLECRGLKFSPYGGLIARPMHKFFNVNERPDTQAGVLDFSRPHIVMDKLDGSMVHPAIVGGEVVFMTRMGRSDHAIKAERHLTPELREICYGLLRGGATPIFEWTAPDNRIVINYEQSALTLLAIRNNVDGDYWSRDTLAGMSLQLVAAHSDTPRTAAEFLDYARAVMNAEGFVIRFEDGLWVKVKADDYVLKHKAKDSIVREKNILSLVLAGSLDDVIPLLSEEDADAALSYRDEVERGIVATARTVSAFVAQFESDDQKTFAVERVPKLPAILKPVAFAVRKGTPAIEAVRSAIKGDCNTQSGVDRCRELHGATWADRSDLFEAEAA